MFEPPSVPSVSRHPRSPIRARCLFPALSGILFLLVGCQTGEHESADRTHEVGGDALPELEEFDWQQGPLVFLEDLHDRYLAMRDHLSDESLERVAFETTVWGIHRDWVKEEDVPGLIAFLEDERPCLGVRMSRSSFISFGQPSTIGNEAAFLIEGFRSEQDGTGYAGYPPALRSIGELAALPDRTAQIRAWWADFERR